MLILVLIEIMIVNKDEFQDLRFKNPSTGKTHKNKKIYFHHEQEGLANTMQMRLNRRQSLTWVEIDMRNCGRVSQSTMFSESICLMLR